MKPKVLAESDISPSSIQTALLAAFPGSIVEVHDLTGGGDHFEAVIVYEGFLGKSPVLRHRMVYEALGPSVGGAIHALAIKARTPEEAQSSR